MKLKTNDYVSRRQQKKKDCGLKILFWVNTD